MSIYIPKSKLLKGLADKQYYIQDTTNNSPDYFNITEFPTQIGGGKSLIKLKGNGTKLRVGSNIDIEVLDVYGNPLYYEVSDLIDRFNQYYVSIYVYDVTAEGIGTVMLTGEALLDPEGNPIPDIWKNKHNVIWFRDVEIKPFERNTSDIVFSTPPEVYVTQVTLAERASSGSIVNGTYTYTKASNIFTITSTDFKGFDKTIAQDDGITDLDQFKKGIAATGKPLTINSVDTTTREVIANSSNAYKVNQVNRFNTILKTSRPFFSASFIGATFEITGSAPAILQPSASGVTLVEPLSTQINQYVANIVDVLDEKTAILDKPLSVKVVQPANNTVGSRVVDWVYRLASQSFGGVVTYLSTTANYVTSSMVQNYIEFTYTNLEPIAGQIYKVRPFYRMSGRTGDYTLLTDQIIKPIEYLADPAYGNQTAYARQATDYYLVGHFTDTGSINRYWDTILETPTGVGYTPTNISNNSTQQSSVVLTASQSYTQILTTNYRQNYIADREYTITTNLTLEPGCELEVYMNSEPLQTNLLTQSPYLAAFNKSANLETNRYTGAVNRFGKFVGRITNSTNTTVRYGKVGFDFLPDNDGLGKPLFRIKSSNYNTTGSAYLSQVSVTATALNGFTPNLTQFAIPFNQFPQLLLSQSVDFKLEYFDYTGRQSEYVTYLKDITINETTEVNAAGCQVEKYNWTFDAKNFHAASRSYTEFVGAQAYNDAIPPALYQFTTEVPLYKYYTTASTADLQKSGSKTDYYWWPFVEDVSGLYISGSNFALEPWYSKGPTQQGTYGHITTYTQKYKFTTGFDIFGIRYSDSDVSLWNVRRPIIRDSNSDPYYNSDYSNNFYLEDGTTPATDGNLLNGIIPSASPGVFFLYGNARIGTGSIQHTNEYPPYTASADPEWRYDGFAGYWTYRSPNTLYYGSWQGKITSSWNWVSRYTENLGTYYMPKWSTHSIMFTSSLDIYATGSYLADHFASHSAARPLVHYSRSLQTSSIDNRWFPYEGAVGITRDAVSASYRDFNAAGTDAARTYALKQRRLMFPMNGKATASYFTTNGGIYDVRFKIKRTGSYSPDTGSYMDVYIFNANTDYTTATTGAPGWKPPSNNIVRIGHGYNAIPLLTNYDPYTNAWFDEYQITLVQYGTPGQIVFEPGGVTGSNFEKYFGTLIDDISICKIGLTTDPNFVAAEAQYTAWTNISVNNHVPASATSQDVIKKIDGGTFTTSG